MKVPLTLGDVARQLGVPTWKVRRLYESGRLPEPGRVGRNRVVFEDEIPKIRAALDEVLEAAGRP